MRKFWLLFSLFSCSGLLLVTDMNMAEAAGDGPGCVPVSCDVSSGDDRLNADTIEISREARKTASRCYICEPGYCETGDVVYDRNFTKFAVCRQSWGWVGNDKWEPFTPSYCTDKPNMTTLATPESGLQKKWQLNGVTYEEGVISGLGGASYASGNSICYYYDCPDNATYDFDKKACVYGASQQAAETPQPASGGGGAQPPAGQSSVERCINSRSSAEGKACCLVPNSIATWDGTHCKCVDSTKEFINGTCVAKATESSEPVVVTFTCPENRLVSIYAWQEKYATNTEISALIEKILKYCFETENITEYQFNIYMSQLTALVGNYEDGIAQQQLAQQQAAQADSIRRIRSIVASLDAKKQQLLSKLSVWKDEDGQFNTSRLVSDSVAGVVLGTAGGLITSNVVKKSQVKNGFEDLNCTIGGQVVAGWGDEFLVGIQ